MIGSDQGLVLRTYPLRETSKIVSVLGRAHGRLRLVANGGRGGRHGFGASLEVGNEVDLVFSLPPGRELGTVREAALRERWVAGSTRLEVLATGLAVVELIDRVLPEGAHDAQLLQAALAALAAQRRSPDRARAVAAFLRFELALLAELGLQPAFDACGRCGGEGRDGGWVDAGAGRFVCRRCGRPGLGWVRLSAEVSEAIHDLVAGTGAGPHPAAVRRSLGALLHRLLAAHVERYRYPRSLGLLKKMDTSRRGSAAPRSGANDLETA